MRSDFQVSVSGGITLTIHREQLPLTPTYAFTDYYSQGQSIPYVIVNIGKIRSSSLTPFNAYVALSRGVGRESVRLLRNFESELFTKTPSKDLEAEEKRLEEFNVGTESNMRSETR